MKNKRNILISLVSLSMLASLSSCDNKSSNKDYLLFSKSNLVLLNFEGLGVEWGTYEDRNKVSNDAWNRSIEIMDNLKPSVVRCMLNYDWFLENFDSKNNQDPNDDTWSYNFNNKYMNNTLEILRYCDVHNIDVAFGCWNVPGNLNDDIMGMMSDVTSDIRWAKMTGDVLEYLIKFQGIHSIKYFVNSNEPNYTGSQGSSKNYNNTFKKWAKGVKQVRQELDNRNLTQVKIIGGDTTGFEGSKEYLGNISKDETLRNSVGDYGFHLYASNYYIDKGTLSTEIKTLYNQVKENDSQLGVTRMPHVWESGLLDGKNNETDSNAYITVFSYGLRMADFTVQCLISGVNSICYWDFDDAMHFMYGADGSMTTKGWGMFSSLTTDSASKQEIRPWYHSSCLLTHLLTKHSKVYDSGFNNPEIDSNFRSLACVDNLNYDGGIVLVNRDVKSVNKIVKLDQKISNDSKTYVYIYNEKDLRLNDKGYVTYNDVIEVSLNSPIEVEVPASSLMVLSSKEL